MRDVYDSVKYGTLFLVKTNKVYVNILPELRQKASSCSKNE